MRGFSLIELMTVLAIMGVLMTLSFNTFTWLSASTKVKNASTDLYLALIRARNEAVKRNRQVAIVGNAAGWQAGWQIIADTAPPPSGDGAFNVASGDRLVIDSGALSRVTIDAGGQTSVVFLTSGRVQNAAMPMFTITSQDKSTMKRCVSTDLTGKPFVKDPGSGACS